MSENADRRRLSDFDHLMIHHAARRGPVVVNDRGRIREATLVSWKPWTRSEPRKRLWSKARVQFGHDSASRATVDVRNVEPVDLRDRQLEAALEEASS